MATVTVACPECGKELRLRDRKLLGKRGKCPACEHRFVLREAEDEEVELELADEAAQVGTGARWVPDSGPAAQTATATAPATSGIGGLDSVSDAGGAARLKEIRRKNAQRRKIGIAAGSFVAICLMGSILWIKSRDRIVIREEKPKRPPATFNQAYLADKQALQENVQVARAVSPTRGEPIQLLMMPVGMRMIFNIHPDVLWEPQSAGEEFRYCLGPLGEWLGVQIKEMCLYEPAQIDRVLVGLSLGTVGSPPEVSLVVELKEEQKRSDMVLMLQGARTEEYGYPVFVDKGRAYMIHDLRTFAVCPAQYAGEMVDSRKFPSSTQPAIEEILHETDRDRHFTMIFDPQEVRRHHEALVSENVRPFLNLFLDWLGDDVEVMAWSLHLGDQFRSDMVLRNRTPATPKMVEAEVSRRLDRLPFELVSAVEKMQPKQLGQRHLIGRFPAMMKVFEMRTMGGIGDRYTQISTVLPERAAPNLALAALLTWDESTRTDFSKAAPTRPDPSEPKLPETIAGRLQLPVEVDFRRTPLQEAFAFLGDEVKVNFEIDGDALKGAGYTKNMAQNHKLGTVPAITALKAIVEQYEKMCLVVDESAKVVTVMTYQVAKAKNLTPLTFK